jgi:hypothetical protein
VVEIVVPRTAPPPMLHLAPLVLLLVLYLALAYLTYATQGFYTYDFLDPAAHGRGRTAAYIVGILVAAIVLFGIVWAVVWLRRWLTERVCGCEGRFARRAAWDGKRGEAGEAEGEEVEMRAVAEGLLDERGLRRGSTGEREPEV